MKKILFLFLLFLAGTSYSQKLTYTYLYTLYSGYYPNSIKKLESQFSKFEKTVWAGKLFYTKDTTHYIAIFQDTVRITTAHSLICVVSEEDFKTIKKEVQLSGFRHILYSNAPYYNTFYQNGPTIITFVKLKKQNLYKICMAKEGLIFTDLEK